MGLNDPRKRKDYSLSELVVGGVMLFVFKEGSRNAFDNDRREAMFRKNYQRAFKLRLPGIDAVEDLYRLLDENELERLKHLLVKTLIEKKMFYKFRFMGKNILLPSMAQGWQVTKPIIAGNVQAKHPKAAKQLISITCWKRSWSPTT